MNFDIPVGLTDLLQGFTVAVLRERPTDIVQFAADYFNNVNENRHLLKSGGGAFSYSSSASLSGASGSFKKGVTFGASGANDEPMQTDSDEEPMEPPKNRFQRRKSVSAERYDPEADEDEDDKKLVYPKSDEQRRRLNEAVKHILLFRSLEQLQMHEVIDAMFEKKVQPMEHVIDQGDDGDNFYVIDSGMYDIYVEVDGKQKCVGSYDNQGSFGELALMYNMPRAATIIATSEGNLWAMDRSTFRRIILKSAFQKRKMYETLLENVPMLKTLDVYERMNIADALQPRTYEDGELIIRQGDGADCMYFVEDGQIKITIKQKDSDEEVEVTQIEKGGYFGELALVTHKPRAASAYAVGTAKCAVLDVQAFERLLGPCMDILKRNIEDYEEQLAEVFGSKANISDLR